jgi:hypothetical protein
MKNFIGFMWHAEHAIFGMRCNLEPDTAISLDNKWATVNIKFNETTKMWMVDGVLSTKEWYTFKVELDTAMYEYQMSTLKMRMELSKANNLHYTSTDIKRMSNKRIRQVYAANAMHLDYDDLAFLTQETIDSENALCDNPAQDYCD